MSLLWEDKIDGDFSVDLNVDFINRRGSLASLTLAISEAESNIENIRAQESDRHHFHVDITIQCAIALISPASCVKFANVKT